MTDARIEAKLDDLLNRIKRTESRLVQLMLHVGADPYTKMYESLGNLADPPRPIPHVQD